MLLLGVLSTGPGGGRARPYSGVHCVHYVQPRQVYSLQSRCVAITPHRDSVRRPARYLVTHTQYLFYTVSTQYVYNIYVVSTQYLNTIYTGATHYVQSALLLYTL